VLRPGAPAGFRRYATLAVFVLALVLSGSPWSSPAIALLLGLVFGLANWNPRADLTSKASKWMLKISVVALGFGMNLHTVFEVGRASLVFTGCGILFGVLLGLGLGRAMNVSPNAALLVGVGTAICGGSAIAAVAPIIDAQEDETAVSLSAVFLLNALALFLFPVIAAALHLTQTQFGLWAAVAIHDTSSVVGAAMRYGADATAIATAVKLVRALWILPVAVITAIALQAKRRVEIPWFIGLFVLATWTRSALPEGKPLWDGCAVVARPMLSMTLFLIGASLSRNALRAIGWRVLVLAVALWSVITCVSLGLIRLAWIHL